MRRSSIQVMRLSRRNSIDQSESLLQENSDDRFQKTNLGQRLIEKGLTRVATEKNLDRIGQQKAEFDPSIQMRTEPHLKDDKRVNIPEYQFLRSKQEIESDPFLKAKMKYLLAKQKPQLIKQMPAIKPPHAYKRNAQNIENESGSYTTLKKEHTKQNSKKLFLLTVGNRSIA